MFQNGNQSDDGQEDNKWGVPPTPALPNSPVPQRDLAMELFELRQVIFRLNVQVALNVRDIQELGRNQQVIFREIDALNRQLEYDAPEDIVEMKGEVTDGIVIIGDASSEESTRVFDGHRLGNS